VGQKQIPQTSFASEWFEFFHNFGGNPCISSRTVGGRLVFDTVPGGRYDLQPRLEHEEDYEPRELSQHGKKPDRIQGNIGETIATFEVPR
jgi:hypothetical protein